ncbi:MAG: exodeoxyribonuclease V subunit alpha [Fibrobacterales bacterium]|nr:exodeoxyribonuclease V subunit alpha [Fibrobacterales bacterium]
MKEDVFLRQLKLFGVPSGSDENTEAVRVFLAKRLENGDLSLSEIQLSRDIAERGKCEDAAVHLFLAAMFVAQRKGDAFLSEKNGERIFNEFGESGLWEKARAAAPGLPEEIVVLEKGKGWFFARNLEAVKCVSALIRERVKKSLPEECPDVEKSIAFTDKTLDEFQKNAVLTATSRHFAVITGGPGTGKTTIVCAILRALLRPGNLRPDEIGLVAPTGRAGQRMTEALRKEIAKAKDEDPAVLASIGSLKGVTIHSLLGGRAPHWKHTKYDQLPHRLVVVDESSMVDLHLMRALLEALRDDCRLVLLGDSHQLPSVDEGAVLGDLATKDGERDGWAVHLEDSHRFKGGLKKASEAINAGDSDALKGAAPALGIETESDWTSTLRKDTTKNCCFRLVFGKMSAQSGHKALEQWAMCFGTLGELATRAKGIAGDPAKGIAPDACLDDGTMTPAAKALFECLDRSRVITVLRNGPIGVAGVNGFFSRKIHGRRKTDNPFDKPGVPVLITRNSRERELYNGDIGVTAERDGMMYALFPRGEKVVVCPVALLPEHELAYAVTVHKSQGSEFGNVLVVLPEDEKNPLLTRELVYTGITRAKERAVILGTEAALKAALANKTDRDTGIEI